MTKSIWTDVSMEELDQHLQVIAREVRLSGTAEEARAFDYIQKQLEAFGYHVTRDACEALIG